MIRPLLPRWLKSEAVEFTLEVLAGFALILSTLHYFGVI